MAICQLSFFFQFKSFILKRHKLTKKSAKTISTKNVLSKKTIQKDLIFIDNDLNDSFEVYKINTIAVSWTET